MPEISYGSFVIYMNFNFVELDFYSNLICIDKIEVILKFMYINLQIYI